MSRFNWQRLRAADQMRRKGTEKVSRLKPLSSEERKLIAYRDPGKTMLATFRKYPLTIKCFNCGHTRKFATKGNKSLPRFRCSVCGHKGYPQKQNATQTAVV